MSVAPIGAGASAAAPARPAAPSPDRKAAEGFERVLLGQLTRTLVDSAMPEGGAAPAAYRDLLPDALGDALAAGGGIGLAKSLEGGS